MNKTAIWGIVVTMLLVILILTGLQFVYYRHVVGLRKEQTRQLTKNALSDVGHDLELRELVRYINEQLSLPRGAESPMTSTLYQISQRGKELSDPGVGFFHYGDRLEVPSVQDLHVDTLAISDQMLRAFFSDRKSLDEYVLHNLYRVYEHDSIPQLVNPRYLQDRVRYRLDHKGVTEAYSLALCDASGRILYEYTQPGMLRKGHTAEDIVMHRLFVNPDNPNKLTPYLRLTLDFSASQAEMLNFALPGMVLTIFVLILGIFSTVMLVRSESFRTLKVSFVNNMTHELKTPVSSIILASQMLRSKQALDSPGSRGRYINIIDMESQRLKMLIDKVLQISLFDGKIREIALSELDVNEILLHAAEVYSAHAEERQGTLDLGLEADNTWVMANSTHLTNILFNLLDNAVKYSSPERALFLGIYTRNVDGQLEIRIEDNGIGIPRDSLKRVFERYYRVPTGYRHDVKGFGLGLSYVQSVVHEFKGHISAEQRTPEGTIMVIRLPILTQEG